MKNELDYDKVCLAEDLMRIKVTPYNIQGDADIGMATAAKMWGENIRGTGANSEPMIMNLPNGLELLFIHRWEIANSDNSFYHHANFNLKGVDFVSYDEHLLNAKILFKTELASNVRVNVKNFTAQGVIKYQLQEGVWVVEFNNDSTHRSIFHELEIEPVEKWSARP